MDEEGRAAVKMQSVREQSRVREVVELEEAHGFGTV